MLPGQPRITYEKECEPEEFPIKKVLTTDIVENLNTYNLHNLQEESI
jgi:hypothetical protein